MLTIAFAAVLILPLAVLAGQAAAAETLAYYSDYFSFVGEDAQGKVAFALDNNRGQDGEQFQAATCICIARIRSTKSPCTEQR